jgi:hypothetical protein
MTPLCRLSSRSKWKLRYASNSPAMACKGQIKGGCIFMRFTNQEGVGGVNGIKRLSRIGDCTRLLLVLLQHSHNKNMSQQWIGQGT